MLRGGDGGLCSGAHLGGQGPGAVQAQGLTTSTRLSQQICDKWCLIFGSHAAYLNGAQDVCPCPGVCRMHLST